MSLNGICTRCGLRIRKGPYFIKRCRRHLSAGTCDDRDAIEMIAAEKGGTEK